MVYKSINNLSKMDKDILKVLKEDSSLSLNEMGEKVGISASTMHNHIVGLRENKIITGYTISFDPAILGLKTTAFVGIELEKDYAMGEKKDRALKDICDTAGVMEAHETLAPFDLILKIRTENVEKLRSTITNIAAIDGVMATNTILTTNRIKESFW